MSTQAHDQQKASSSAAATSKSSQFESRPFEASVNSAFAPVTNPFHSRPFAVPASPQPSSAQQATPDLQAQLKQAKRFNYDLSEVNLFATGTTPPEPPPSPVIQPKLTIGEPGDRYEQEADSVAAQVMSMSVPVANSGLVQRQGDEEETPLVQRSPLAASITPLVQRHAEEQEEPIQTKSLLQRAGAKGNAEAGSDLENKLSSSKGGGSPLADDVRGFMEPRFGADFSSVRVHTDSTAVQMNKDLGAQAFTHGSDIYFGGGKSPAISDLTAHELTHVVQQTGAKTLQRKPLVSRRSNKETLQAKISPALSVNSPIGLAIQCKQAPASPQEDPAFQSVVKRTETEASGQKSHPPATAKSAEAQAAAQPPANEVESKAQNRQVQEMNQQQPGQFNAEAFKAALMEKITAVTPNSLEEAEKFKDNNKIDSVKQEVSSKVTDEKKQASEPIEEKTKEAPNTEGIEPKPVTPLPPQQAGSQPRDVGADGAAPKAKDASEVSLEEGSQQLDQQMAQANVTDEQLEKSNEPEFQAALGAKNEAQAHATTAPPAYRQQEQATLTQAQTQAQTTAQTQMEGMHGNREQLLTQVVGLQQETKGQDEQERAAVATKINGFYDQTKTEVETILNGLDTEVTSKFDTGAAAAKQQFENYVAQKMEAYKQQRYGEWYDVSGWDERVHDAVVGLPPEVNVFFVEGRKLYLAEMDITLTTIANHVAAKLNEAKQKIASGKQQIQDYVASLPANLRQVGQDAAQKIQGKFNELEQSVDNKQNELIDSLAQKYSENLQQLDTRIEEMKAENRGWVDKAKDAIGGTIQTIMQLKDMLMGVLAKAAGAIDKIILDPIGFLGNLISGIKQGFQNFAGNISQHLKKGMLAFLTGALAGAGITMPESFDLKGIFSLVMQVLGVVYDGIKSRVIKALGKNGEKMFTALESSFEMFVILKNEGVAGLWQFIQDKIGDLKAMVIDTIQTFVVESVIKAGVMWVLSLLNPASAFVRACKAIYDIIMFFIERGSQIAELVSAVTESMAAIASGAVGGAAKLIENALGTSLPVVISFMASLLGLGGISEKIEGIIKTVRAPIDKAIDWLIAQAVKFAKKIGNKLGFGKDKKGKDNKESKPNKLEDSEVPFSMAGESHTLTLKEQQGKLAILMASSQQLPLTSKFQSLYTEIDDWRHFLEQYVYPKVSSDIQQQIESKLKHLKAIRQTQVSKYQKSYEDTFGNRRGDTGHQNPNREKNALNALTNMAKNDLAAIQEWATNTGVKDLSPEAVKNNLRQLGTKFFDQAVEDRRQKVNDILSKFKTRNGAPVKYRGSLAEGKRGPHKGEVRFNPDDFDLDLYVVDHTEHAAVLQANPILKAEPNAPIPASRARGHILQIQQQVVQALEAPGAVPGIRVGKNYILLRKTAP